MENNTLILLQKVNRQGSEEDLFINANEEC